MRNTSRRKPHEQGRTVVAEAAGNNTLKRLDEILDHMKEWLIREDVRALYRVRLEDEVQDGLEILQGLRPARRKRRS